MLKSFFAPIKGLNPAEKKNIILLTLSFFFVLMSYPILRSSSDAFFIQSHGAKNWPWATFYSVVTLSLAVFFFNEVQRKVGVKKLYLMISLFSAVFFFLSALAFRENITSFAYLTYVWKECYIVILIHLCLAFFHSNFSYDFAKSFFGPFGAIASVGAILGGTFTSFMTREIGVFWLIIFGAVLCLVPPLFFIFTSQQREQKANKGLSPKNTRPLASVREIWPYITSITGIIVITQFIISIVNFKLNFSVQNSFASVVDKTVFFGKIYTLINIATLIIHSILTPIALRTIQLRTNHLVIVSIYLIVLLPMLFFLGQVIIVISSIFILSKAIDYSFFGTVKEMLYYPLSEYQKYGAKYIIDMVMYRASKGIVSLILTQTQNFRVLDVLLTLATLVWFILTFNIFKHHNQLQQKWKQV